MVVIHVILLLSINCDFSVKNPTTYFQFLFAMLLDCLMKLNSTFIQNFSLDSGTLQSPRHALWWPHYTLFALIYSPFSSFFPHNKNVPQRLPLILFISLSHPPFPWHSNLGSRLLPSALKTPRSRVILQITYRYAKTKLIIFLPALGPFLPLSSIYHQLCHFLDSHTPYFSILHASNQLSICVDWISACFINLTPPILFHCYYYYHPNHGGLHKS